MLKTKYAVYHPDDVERKNPLKIEQFCSIATIWALQYESMYGVKLIVEPIRSSGLAFSLGDYYD